jgi:hypothetical protein
MTDRKTSARANANANANTVVLRFALGRRDFRRVDD